MDQEYTGKNITRHFGQPYLLSNPDELNILANAMENKLGCCYKTHIINCHRHHKGYNIVCKSTVDIAFLRLQTKRTRIQKSNRVLIIRVSGKKQDDSKQNNDLL